MDANIKIQDLLQRITKLFEINRLPTS